MNETTKTLMGDVFSIGDSAVQRPVVEDDFACEYSVMSYLAAALAGANVGIGTYYLEAVLTDEEMKQWYPDLRSRPSNHMLLETNLLYIPNVGLWLLQPVFRCAREPRAHLERVACLLARQLGMSREELPINFALVQTVPDMAFDARRVDPAEIYDVDTFRDVLGTFIRGARPLPPDFDLDHFALRVLSRGDLVDAKNGCYDDWELPRWLDEALYPLRNAA